MKTKLEREFDALFEQWTSGTPREKLERAVAQFRNVSGRPGVEQVRKRVAIIEIRLQQLEPRAAERAPAWGQGKPQSGRGLDRQRWAAFWHQERLNGESPDERRVQKYPELKAEAMRLAKLYHRHIGSLYSSKHASIQWGSGSEGKSWDVYSKHYGFPAKWKNAGVRVSFPNGAPHVVMTTARGKVIDLPLPKLVAKLTAKKLLGAA